VGQHAFLGASNYHWINYSETKLLDRYFNLLAIQKGTALHEYASMAIRLGLKQPRTKQSLNMYINDAIGFKMIPEQILYYSENCFGTADAISFRGNTLRIHDLKTGVTPAKMEQLEIYAALFCLEYKTKPSDINIELRIYQSDDISCHESTAEELVPLMDKIITFDKIIMKIKSEESWL
jgi:hypothetical protein